MSCIEYRKINIHREGRILIDLINTIIADYTAAGYTLTTRQIFYQLVTQNVIPNTDKAYRKIQNLVKNGRLAGLIDWEAVVDRTRTFHELPHWESPAEILRSAAYSYHRDLWEGQDRYCEIWVEKQALENVVQQAAERLDCPYFSCRGYPSITALLNAAKDRYTDKEDRECSIIYLGDHDPSGLDIDRQLKERITEFGANIKVQRIALTMDQVKEYKLPPNPVKVDPDTEELTDTRAKKYVEKYGLHSWELDALRPEVLDALITDAIESNLDSKLYSAALGRQEAERKQIIDLAKSV
jgi:hypothetical protein